MWLCQEPNAEEYKTAPLRLGQLQRYLNAAEQLGMLPLIYIGLRQSDKDDSTDTRGNRPPNQGTRQASKQSADVHASSHAEALLATDGAPDA